MYLHATVYYSHINTLISCSVHFTATNFRVVKEWEVVHLSHSNKASVRSLKNLNSSTLRQNLGSLHRYIRLDLWYKYLIGLVVEATRNDNWVIMKASSTTPHHLPNRQKINLISKRKSWSIRKKNYQEEKNHEKRWSYTKLTKNR